MIKKICIVFQAAALALLVAGGCGKGLQVFAQSEPIAPFTVQGGGVLQALLSALGTSLEDSIRFTIAAEAERQGDVIRIHMERFGLRTLTGDPADGESAALVDADLIEPCRPDQKPLSWIHSVEITIRRAGEPASETLLASFTLPPEQRGSPEICGFFLDVDDRLNINDYLPDFEVDVRVEGEVPAEDTTVGGFYRVAAYLKL